MRIIALFLFMLLVAFWIWKTNLGIRRNVGININIDGMKHYTILITLSLLFSIVAVRAQEVQEIDASKPTNFYSFLNNSLEFTSRQNKGNLVGYRAGITYSPSERHLILGEVPLLYNIKREKFGFGDIRVRYFYLPYKNYEKFIGALGPSIDIIAPVGNTSNGIGAGRWIIAPGVATALMFADWVQVFPVLSYQYMSKPVIKDTLEVNDPINGITLQFISVFALSPKAFVAVTPIFNEHFLAGTNSFSYIQEVSFGYMVAPKGQISAYLKGDFKDKLYQMSVGYTVFF